MPSHLYRLVCLLLLWPTALWAATPWMPIPGANSLTLSYVQQSGDALYLGSERTSLPDDLELKTWSLAYGRGLSDDVSLFVNTGHAASSFSPAGPNDEGLIDSRLGLQWQLCDEFISGRTPTLSLRVAAIIDGDYDVGRVDAIGDGESGYEASLILGKLFGGFAIWGEAGIRNRSDPVPTESFYDLGAAFGIGEMISAYIGYLIVKSSGELDIGAEGFSPDRFPEVGEDQEVLKVGLNFALGPRWALGLNYSTVEGGRNTSISEAFGVALSLDY